MFKRLSALLAAVLAAFLFVATPAFAQNLSSAFRNIDEIASQAGFDVYQDTTAESFQKRIRIAVLDNGFRGYEKQIGKTLPRGTRLKRGPIAVDPKTEENHGLMMAQLIAGLLDRVPGLQYDLQLFSAYGYTNLESAVKEVIKGQFDIVLYAQVWEYGGNGDGRGFINALVNKAVRSGITWVNAAGNVGTSTYRAPVRSGEDGWARLPGPNDSVRVRCQSQKCSFHAVLAWNDFKDDVKIGTDKDLDLILTDDTLRVVTSSALQQKISFPESEAASSLYPREFIDTEVEQGLYYLRVKMRSQNWQSRDELRITIKGDGLQLLDAKPGETILPPADNANVIAVGALDSNMSSSSRKLGKPDLMMNSRIVLMTGEEARGTSSASAITAAAVAVLKAERPELRRTEIVRALSGGAVRGGSRTNPEARAPLPAPRTASRRLPPSREPEGETQPPIQVRTQAPPPPPSFWPTGPGCFLYAHIPFLPDAVQALGNSGLSVVQTSQGIKIVTKVDPFQLVGANREYLDDALIVGPRGFEIISRTGVGFLPPGTYEVAQFPRGQVFCSLDGLPPGGARVGARW